VRLQAAVDGQAIDPWHLAALLEGLRLRMDHALRIIDRGAIFEAARHALALHQWLASPDFDQEGEVQRAERVLAAAAGTPLLAAASGFHAWIEAGGARPPLRAALVRHWTRHRLLRTPVPLTGVASLRPGVDWAWPAWAPGFLRALAEEAADAQQLLLDLERAWCAARAAVAGRRRTSRAAAAVDLLAAAPLVSAPSLAAGLGMAAKNAAALLDSFCAFGHRRRGDAPLEAAALRPRRARAAARRGGRAAAQAAGTGAGAAAQSARRGPTAAAAAAWAPADPVRTAGVRHRRLGGGDGVRR
jgi:hypothetical protein